jgi:CelD/BcsL family acetyltransferase involved in cellulose biosynthesis
MGPFTIGRALGPEFYEACDVLVREAPCANAWAQQAWDFALSGFDVLRLPAVRSTGHLWSPLHRSGARRYDPIASVYIDTSAWTGWDDYYRSRSSNFRKDHRTSLRRLQQAGTVRWHVVDQQHRVADSLEWMFTQKLNWLERTGGDATLANYKDFYARLCSDSLASGELLLIELLVNDRRIAAQVGFRAGRRLDCDMIAWDPAWKACGPGRALDIHTIQWAFENGVRFIELGVFGHPSKERFTDRSVETAFNVFATSGLRGRVLLHMRDVLHRVRPGRREKRSDEAWESGPGRHRTPHST